MAIRVSTTQSLHWVFSLEKDRLTRERVPEVVKSVAPAIRSRPAGREPGGESGPDGADVSSLVCSRLDR